VTAKAGTASLRETAGLKFWRTCLPFRVPFRGRAGLAVTVSRWSRSSSPSGLTSFDGCGTGPLVLAGNRGPWRTLTFGHARATP
jgi:hypothetical protein